METILNFFSGAVGPYSLTEDGLLDIMATKYVNYLYHIMAMPIVYIFPCSHIGHFVLTEGLLPLLKSTALEEGSDVRIINVRHHAESTLEY